MSYPAVVIEVLSEGCKDPSVIRRARSHRRKSTGAGRNRNRGIGSLSGIHIGPNPIAGIFGGRFSHAESLGGSVPDADMVDGIADNYDDYDQDGDDTGYDDDDYDYDDYDDDENGEHYDVDAAE